MTVGSKSLLVSEKVLCKASGHGIRVLGASFGIDVVDGSGVCMLAAGKVEASTKGRSLVGRLDIGKDLVFVFRTPRERLAGRVGRTRRDVGYERSIGGGDACKGSKAEPERDKGDQSKQALVPGVEGACHRYERDMRAEALEGEPRLTSRCSKEKLY